ncbi:MAG TPA: NAD(P)H-dependent oxidoreductase subunit E [Acidimicrobiales bacterium]|jgi:NADH-quinone oxidoreductase E subunit|nr:NAD(P)H-dependent oxidoreductase subunit E [Acidimicrobiales bacterium]
MARLSPDNVQRARDLMALYPEPRSALIPILHIAQEQDGWLTEDAMEHVAELVGTTAAEVYGTASFYDMLFTEPVGKHLVSICTNIACLLNGGYELLEHAEKSLGVKAGSTTADGQFTLEEVECIADCGRAPCLAVNWRFFGNVGHDAFDTLVDDLRSDRLKDTVPPHGTLNRVRRDITAWAGGVPAAQAAAERRAKAAAPAAPAPAAEAPVAPAAAPTPTDQDQRGEAQPASAAAAEHAAAEADSITEPGDTAPGDTAPESGGSRPQKGDTA